MDDLHYFGFDPANANLAAGDPSLLLWGLLVALAALIVPGIVAYYTWSRRAIPAVVREIRTGAEDLTPGERAFIEREARERERHPSRRERRKAA